MLVLTSAVFLTVNIAQQQQTIKQHAESYNCGGSAWINPDWDCFSYADDCNMGLCRGDSGDESSCQKVPSNPGGSCNGGNGTCNSNGECDLRPTSTPPPPGYNCGGLAWSNPDWDCFSYADECNNGLCRGYSGNESSCQKVPKEYATPCWSGAGYCDGNGNCISNYQSPTEIPSPSSTCNANGLTCIDSTGTYYATCNGAAAVYDYTCDQNKCKTYSEGCPSGTTCKIAPDPNYPVAYCDNSSTDQCSMSNNVCIDKSTNTPHPPTCDGIYTCPDKTKPCQKSLACPSGQTCSMQNSIPKCAGGVTPPLNPTTKPLTPSSPPCPPVINPTVPPYTTPAPGSPTPTSDLATVTLVSALNAQDVFLTADTITTAITLYSLSTNTMVSDAPAAQVYNSTKIPGRQYSATITIANLFLNEKYFVVIRYNNMIAKTVFAVTNSTRTITAPTTTLVFGDVNSDDDINIIDYNLLRSCWKNPATGSCTASDFDQSGGSVDEVDYNTWLRGFATWEKEAQVL